MIRRHRNGELRAAALAVLLACAPASALAAGESRAVDVRVTYVTSATVYLDAGSEAGLREGRTIEIRRDGEGVTTLEVTALSSKRASCRRPDPSIEIRVGDIARFTPAADRRARRTEVSPPADVPAAPPRRSVGGWLSDRGVRGRIGIRYLGVFDASAFGATYSQPALDLRLDGTPPNHPSVRYTADVRARRTYRTAPDGDSDANGRTRVYRLQAEWDAGRGVRAVVGRQYSQAITSVGVFDGAAVEARRGRWTAGAFSGTQPDAVDFGFSTDLRQHGLWVGWRESGAGHSRWNLTGGLIGSYEGGEIDRENAVLQVRYSGPRLFASGIQEIDINRGWKSDAEGSALSSTSSFVSARYRVSERVLVDGGFDSRRNVRHTRDRITPETEFDDDARRGVWTGVEVSPVRSARVGFNARRTSGGASGAADSGTLTARGWVGTSRRVSLGGRSTAYRNDLGTGRLHSLSVGTDIGGRAHVELTGGTRSESPANGGTRSGDLRWLAADSDFRLSSAWLLLVSIDRSSGENEESTQVFSSIVIRF